MYHSIRAIAFKKKKEKKKTKRTPMALAINQLELALRGETRKRTRKKPRSESKVRSKRARKERPALPVLGEKDRRGSSGDGFRRCARARTSPPAAPFSLVRNGANEGKRERVDPGESAHPPNEISARADS